LCSLWDIDKEEKKKGDFIGNELFDHKIDPQENYNIAIDPEYKKTVELISQQLNKGWRYSKPPKSTNR